MYNFQINYISNLHFKQIQFTKLRSPPTIINKCIWKKKYITLYNSPDHNPSQHDKTCMNVKLLVIF